jgi:hypothetical protein
MTVRDSDGARERPTMTVPVAVRGVTISLRRSRV